MIEVNAHDWNISLLIFLMDNFSNYHTKKKNGHDATKEFVKLYIEKHMHVCQ